MALVYASYLQFRKRLQTNFLEHPGRVKFKEMEFAKLFQVYMGIDPAEKIDTEEQERVVTKNVLERSMSLLTSHRDASAMEPALRPFLVPAEAEKATMTKFDERADEDLGWARQEFKNRVLKMQGFITEIKKSSIENAGSGLFLKGTAKPGDVIAFMPGVTYARDQLRQIYNYPNVARENLSLVGRVDGSVIDSDDEVAWKLYSHLEWKAEGPKQFWTSHYNLSANGQYINHPPEGTLDNVQTLAVDFHRATLSAEGLSRWFPYIEVKPGMPHSVRTLLYGIDDRIIPGMVIIATKDIEDGEEIFRNYRLQGSKRRALPEWFVDPEPSLTELRWSRD